jgi:Holliday junction resolvase-like predicted endonuclease
MKPAFRNEEENLAAKYLREAGFKVLSRNDRRFGAELDFLCALKADDELFIFEVKKKPRPRSAAYPRISAAQLKRLRKAAVQIQADAGKFLTVRISLLIVDKVAGQVELIPDI